MLSSRKVILGFSFPILFPLLVVAFILIFLIGSIVGVIPFHSKRNPRKKTILTPEQSFATINDTAQLDAVLSHEGLLASHLVSSDVPVVHPVAKATVLHSSLPPVGATVPSLPPSPKVATVAPTVEPVAPVITHMNPAVVVPPVVQHVVQPVTPVTVPPVKITPPVVKITPPPTPPVTLPPVVTMAPAQPAPTTSNSANFEITCYDLLGTTASGTQVGAGQVAVDPKIIPLGSHLSIAGMGNFTATDTGGAIIGRHIDVWFSNPQACLDFGVQNRAVSY